MRGSASRRHDGATGAEGRRSPARATALILGAVLAVAAVVVVVLTLGGGSKSSPAPSGGSPSPSAPAARTGSVRAASNPGVTRVAVLNGTGTPGLAGRLAQSLRSAGYRQAQKSAAQPPGTHPTTTVYYSSGHRADARAVAKALQVSALAPMDSATRAESKSAPVLVVAGADQATASTGAGSSAGGAPSSGSGSPPATGAGGGSGQ